MSAENFLRFIIHQHNIKIDPPKIEAIRQVQAPTCKKDMQRFTQILRRKDGDGFIWDGGGGEGCERRLVKAILDLHCCQGESDWCCLNSGSTRKGAHTYISKSAFAVCRVKVQLCGKIACLYTTAASSYSIIYYLVRPMSSHT